MLATDHKNTELDIYHLDNLSLTLMPAVFLGNSEKQKALKNKDLEL